MGRKSALSAAQWDDVDRRLLADEPARAIARLYRVSEATIRNRKNTHTAEIRIAANKVVEAEQALTELPVSSRRVALTFAQKLQTMSDNLAEAGMLGAQSAAHLGGLAHRLAIVVRDGNLSTKPTAKALAQHKELQAMANDAADIAVRVVSSQKEAIRRAHEVPPADAPDLSHLTDAELVELERLTAKAGGG